jgi:hypothetical protein
LGGPRLPRVHRVVVSGASQWCGDCVHAGRLCIILAVRRHRAWFLRLRGWFGCRHCGVRMWLVCTRLRCSMKTFGAGGLEMPHLSASVTRGRLIFLR